MTGYTVHTGTSKKFVAGFDRIFGGSSDASIAKSSTAKSASDNSTQDASKKKKSKTKKSGKSKK